MKKVSVIVVYNSTTYTVLSVTAIHKENHISLICADSKIQLEQGTSFNDMYSKVLSLLKVNNMYCGYMEAFGRRFYNIAWINVKTFAIEKFGYSEKGRVS